MSTKTQDVFQNAYKNISEAPEALPAVGRSFIIGFAANVIFSLGSPWAGVVGGAVSATASLIDAAVRPAIHNIFDENFRDTEVESITRNVVVLSLLSLTSAAVTPLFGLSVGFSILTSMFVRLVYKAASGESMGRTQFIPIRLY